MSFKDNVQGFIDGMRLIADEIALVAAKMRGPLHKLTWFLIAAQAAYATGEFNSIIPKDSNAAKWVAVASGLIALYTMGKREAANVIREKTGEEPAKP